MRWAVLAGAVLAAFVIAVFVVGALLPVNHVATAAIDLKQPPEKIWTVIADEESAPAWRGEVKSVRRLQPQNGHEVWQETNQHGQSLELETTVYEPPSQLVRKIITPGAGFGGEWEYRITPVEGGSIVQVTERGEVYNPLFRFVSMFVKGHDATMKQYLRDLARRFGEEARWVR